MTTRILTSILLILPFLEAAAQSDDYARSWGIHANFGGITQSESENADSRENEGNTFAVTADWFVTPRLALTGGIYAEQTGMLTHLDADGIGPKSFWMAGRSEVLLLPEEVDSAALCRGGGVCQRAQSGAQPRRVRLPFQRLQPLAHACRLRHKVPRTESCAADRHRPAPHQQSVAHSGSRLPLGNLRAEPPRCAASRRSAGRTHRAFRKPHEPHHAIAGTALRLPRTPCGLAKGGLHAARPYLYMDKRPQLTTPEGARQQGVSRSYGAVCRQYIPPSAAG